nr:E3 ubiquitin-protein ligase MIB2-like [Penaeus vannamei]
MPGIKALITKAQLRWVGHVIWMNDSHLPRMVFFSELASDARNIGRRLKRFKDCLKTSLVACGSTPLYLASLNGHVAVVETLARKGGTSTRRRVKNFPKFWCTLNTIPCVPIAARRFAPLHRAAQYGHVEVIKLLATKGADLNVKNIWGEEADPGMHKGTLRPSSQDGVTRYSSYIQAITF